MVTWFSNVTYIDLNISNVTAISGDIMTKLLKNKTYLNIAKNSLKYLPWEIEGAGNGTELWIGGNLYECNCDMLWMRDWLVTASAVRDRDHAVCTTGKMKGQCKMRSKPQWSAQMFVNSKQCNTKHVESIKNSTQTWQISLLI